MGSAPRCVSATFEQLAPVCASSKNSSVKIAEAEEEQRVAADRF